MTCCCGGGGLTSPLVSSTKQMLVDVIQSQPGDSLPEILWTPASEHEVGQVRLLLGTDLNFLGKQQPSPWQKAVLLLLRLGRCSYAPAAAGLWFPEKSRVLGQEKPYQRAIPKCVRVRWA